MITQKQLKIFEALAKKPFTKLERKEIKSLAKEKSNNALSLAIKQFTKEDIIKIQKIGKSFLICLNLDNDLTYYYLALANFEKMNKDVQVALKIVKEEIEKVTYFYSLVIFGSYAIQEQKNSQI